MCRGKRSILKQVGHLSNPFKQRLECPMCSGHGVRSALDCSKCNGSGHTEENVAVRLRVPPGTTTGACLRLFLHVL
jgi:DnaJ-class molecular chaperone